MPLYECIFIARQDIPYQDVAKLSDKLAEIFTADGGKVIKKESWGLRNLAYAIKKNKKGYYTLLGVEASNNAIKEFERMCKINEDVIKHISIKVKKHDMKPSMMMQAPVKAMLGATDNDSN